MMRPKGPSKKCSRLITVRVGSKEFTTWWMSCCGIGAFALRRPDGTQGENPVPRRTCWRCGVKRPDKSSAAGLPSLAEVDDSVVLSFFTSLSDLVLNPNWEDKTPKGKRCLMFFIDESAVRVLVKLEGDGLKCSAVGRTFDECLGALEMLLKDNTIVWEQDTPSPHKGRKKRA